VFIASRFDTVVGREKKDFGKLGWKFPEKKEDKLENDEDVLGEENDEVDDDEVGLKLDCDCLGSRIGLCSVP